MVQRKFQVHHKDSEFDVDYDADDGFEVFKFQLFSITSVLPEHQKIVGLDDDRTVLADIDLAAVSEKLRLVSIAEEDGSQEPASEMIKSDEELARMLQAEEDALVFQRFAPEIDDGRFEKRIRPYVDQVRWYEDVERQEAARKTVPIDELEEKALVSLAKEGNFKPSKSEQDHAFLLQLLFWFKQSFRWVNSPPCDGCSKETTAQGMGGPLSSELRFGASRVELYRCNFCPAITRFPRYNDPIKLVETRRGRCGEWANCFTLYCRAFGYESRLILDFTDHVWTECFSSHFGSKVGIDERIEFCLAGNPVQTSIALPVALNFLDDAISYLKNCKNFGEGSLSLPLLRPNRIHSGSVLASGEEIPFGIATAAFDGIRTSKWEEPNGGRGCWIIYKLPDGQKRRLVAYELMSANDAPERDPMDWVLEGSEDGGSSWHVMDEQKSQKFGERFQRQTYKIASPGQPSSAFRFRFLAVRDGHSQSRLQIGCIDLYL